jgi:hypothetical protein
LKIGDFFVCIFHEFYQKSVELLFVVTIGIAKQPHVKQEQPTIIVGVLVLISACYYFGDFIVLIQKLNTLYSINV